MPLAVATALKCLRSNEHKDLAEIYESDLMVTSFLMTRHDFRKGGRDSDINLMFIKDSSSAMLFTSFPCVRRYEFCRIIIGIGAEVKLNLTTLWLKLQNIKGCYGYRYNGVAGNKKHTFAMALASMASKKVGVDDMLTHKFPLGKYREMIEVNLQKEPNRAMKTAVSFE